MLVRVLDATLQRLAAFDARKARVVELRLFSGLTLGFRFLGYAGPDDEPYYAEMAAATIKFGLHEPTAESQRAMVGRQRLYFRVRDLAAHRSRVLAWGGQPTAVKETAWMDMFIARDRDGNEIVFAVTDAERHAIDPWHAEPVDAPAHHR